MEAHNVISVDRNLYYPADGTVPDDWKSETTSLTSSAYKGFMENGRRYQTFVERESHVPSDDQMFDAYEASHLVASTLDSNEGNPFFRAPIGKSLTNILDVGTGKGSWAIDVADKFPETTVRGVDLFPPPVHWIPPNCIFEVDDILQHWTWREPFDLVHLRILDSAFTLEETDHLYNQCYSHMTPGGWIEQLEISAFIECDDGTVPADSILFSWGPRLALAAKKAKRPSGIMRTMRDSIEKAGFTDIRVRDYKWPIGPWPKDRQLKDAGMVNFQHWNSGMEGYAMWLLTKFGDPVPWSKEEVQVYVAKMRNELSTARYHCYHRARRVWARKPTEAVGIKIEPT